MLPDVMTEWFAWLCTGMTLPVLTDDTDDAHLTKLVERCRLIAPLPTRQQELIATPVGGCYPHRHDQSPTRAIVGS